MPQSPVTDSRSGPRYVAAFPVRAEWDTSDGVHIVSEGETENVGPEGTLIHLQRDLPPVGSRVNLLVLGDDGEKLRVVAEVLRIEVLPDSTTTQQGPILLQSSVFPAPKNPRAS